MPDRRRPLVSTFALALALGAALAFAAAPATAGDTPPPPGDPAAHHQQMESMHAELMAKLTAMDAKVDGLLAAMNAASGDAKVDAIAAVVTELAAQRKELREMVMQGMQAMPSHDHMSMGDHGMMHGEHGGDCCKEGAACCSEGAACCGKGDCCAHAGKEGECSAASTPMACGEGEAKTMDCCAKHEGGAAMACCAGKHGAADAASHPPGH